METNLTEKALGSAGVHDKSERPLHCFLVFDGRNPVDPKFLANETEKTRKLCELWVAYNATKRLGRRVPCGSDGREMGCMSLPIPRTAMAIKERGPDAKHWGETTHDTVYVDMDAVSWYVMTRCLCQTPRFPTPTVACRSTGRNANQ